MTNQVEIHNIRALSPVLVNYTDESGYGVELFYLDHVTGDIRYATTPTLPVPDQLVRAIIDYVKLRTPPLKVPPLPEKPDYKQETFTQM